MIVTVKYYVAKGPTQSPPSRTRIHWVLSRLLLYNHTAHVLSPLWKGVTISIQNPNSHQWDIARRIVETLPNHQCRIRVAGSGSITLWNSRFLRKLKAPIIETPIPSALPVSPEPMITDMGDLHQSTCVSDHLQVNQYLTVTLWI